MEIKGVDIAFVTLHCGLGCFRNMDVEDLTKHKMDSEQMFVNTNAVKLLTGPRTKVTRLSQLVLQ